MRVTQNFLLWIVLIISVPIHSYGHNLFHSDMEKKACNYVENYSIDHSLNSKHININACGDTDVTFTNITNTSVTVNWTSVPNATIYNLLNPPSWALIGQFTAGTTSFTVSGLSPNMIYTYCVDVWCGDEVNSGNCSSVTTTGGISTPCNAPLPSVGDITHQSATISWPDISNATSYIISDQSGNQIATVPGGTNFYDLINLNPETDYSICVQAVCNGSTSELSCVNFTTGTAPTGGPCGGANLSVSNNTSGTTATLNWGNLNVDVINVYMTAPAWIWIGQQSGTSTSVDLSGLTFGVTYTVCIDIYCNNWKDNETVCFDFVAGEDDVAPCPNGITVPTWSPSDAQHGIEMDLGNINPNIISSHIIGTNRNHVVTDFDVINFEEEMFTAYNDRVNPQFGEGHKRKLYRIGHMPTDGVTGQPWGEGFFFDQIPFNQTGPYAYDHLHFALDEAINDINADISIVANLGDPTGSANMVTYLIQNNYIDRVKYFEIGNEIGWLTNQLHCVYGCNWEDYITQAVIVEQAMRAAAATTGHVLNIGFVGSIAADWGNAGCRNNDDPSTPWNEITQCDDGPYTGPNKEWGDYTTFLPNMINYANNNNGQIDFFIFHNYLSYPLISKSALFDSSNSNSMIGAYCLANNVQTINTLKLVRQVIDDAAGPGNTIGIASTEGGTELDSHEDLMTRSIEGLYAADKIITAANMELLTDVAFCFIHQNGNNNVTDNLFFNLYESNTDNLIKPTFEVHEFMAANLGDNLIESNFVLPPATPLVNLGNPSLPLFNYDLISFSATKRAADGTISLALLNRSESSETIDISPINGGTVQSVTKKVLLSNGFDQTSMEALPDENLCSLIDVTLDPLSITFIEITMSPNGSRREELAKTPTKTPFEINVFPNPASHEVTLEIFSNHKETTELGVSMYDINGKMVSAKNMNLKTGQNRMHWDINALSNGVYYITLNHGDTLSTARFIKTE